MDDAATSGGMPNWLFGRCKEWTCRYVKLTFSTIKAFISLYASLFINNTAI